MLDPDLPVMDKCELHLPIKGSQHTWPRPDGHKERLVWELHLGGWTFESGGLPACESITLTPYMVDITPGASPAAIRAAARDPARRQRLQLDSDEPPILSLESSRRWDVDPRFKKPDVRRISGARVSYEQRWRIFVTWIHYVCEVGLVMRARRIARGADTAVSPSSSTRIRRGARDQKAEKGLEDRPR